MTTTTLVDTRRVGVAEEVIPRPAFGPLSQLKGMNRYAADVGLACLVYPDAAGQDVLMQKNLGRVTRMAVAEMVPTTVVRSKKRSVFHTSHYPYREEYITAREDLDRPLVRHQCATNPCQPAGDCDPRVMLHLSPSSAFRPHYRGLDDDINGNYFLPAPPPAETPSSVSLLTSSTAAELSSYTTARKWSSVSTCNLRRTPESCDLGDSSSIYSAIKVFLSEPIVRTVLVLQYVALILVLCFIAFCDPGMFSS